MLILLAASLFCWLLGGLMIHSGVENYQLPLDLWFADLVNAAPKELKFFLGLCLLLVALLLFVRAVTHPYRKIIALLQNHIGAMQQKLLQQDHGNQTLVLEMQQLRKQIGDNHGELKQIIYQQLDGVFARLRKNGGIKKPGVEAEPQSQTEGDQTVARLTKVPEIASS